MKKEKIEQVLKLKKQINDLPSGYVTTKNINGNIYYYHQWSENGKKYSKYLSDNEANELNKLIEKRQQLEIELKLLKGGHEGDYSIFTLMHKDTRVIDLYIDTTSGLVLRIGKTYSINHLPVGCVDEKNNVNSKNIIEWWNSRSIPLSRSGINNILDVVNIKNPLPLLLKCHGLSLSDQYWIKSVNEELSYEDINYFDHDFSEDVGRLLFGEIKTHQDLNLSSPDNTSVGNLKKRWKISNGERVLIKGGSNPYRQEPINEVVASLVAKELDIDVVNYSLFYIDNVPYCECLDFINKDVDLITANQINQVLKKNNNESSYSHLIKCLNYLNVPNYLSFIDKMIIFDFIIANEDRHFNNFGFLRDTSSLSFIGPAPIFDSGSSFGFDKVAVDIKPFKDIVCKPFLSNHIDQLKLVSSFSFVDIEKIKKIPSIVEMTFKQYESEYIDEKRIASIYESVKERINYLIKYINERND